MSRKLKGARELRPAPYTVGYGKPPVETRFRPGVSGNPGGRPKGARNRPKLGEHRLQDIILSEAYRAIPVRDGERMIDIPIAQAVVRSLAVNAAKGRHRAQTLFTQLLNATEQAREALRLQWVETAIEYKANWELELERRARTGQTGPEPLPHPDDVHVDLNTGEVEIRGPMTKEEQMEIAGWKERLVEFEEDLERLRKYRRESTSREANRSFDRSILSHERMISMVRKRIACDYKGMREDYAAWRGSADQ